MAFDGSGKIERNISVNNQKKSYSICKFSSGKIYNCDLNASYNIGARYFLREMVNQDERLKFLLPSTPNRVYKDLQLALAS